MGIKKKKKLVCHPSLERMLFLRAEAVNCAGKVDFRKESYYRKKKKNPTWSSTKSPLMWNGLVGGFDQKPHKFQSPILSV